MQSETLPFTQVETARSQVSGGLGIGLALVRSLVELHGGSVAAHSPGPCARRGIHLATAAEFSACGPRARRHRKRSRRRSRWRRRILIADDNEDAAQSLAALLRLDGHDVHLAADGAEAVARASALQPEVIHRAGQEGILRTFFERHGRPTNC